MSKEADRPDLKLDSSSEQGFCKFFRGLDERANTIRLFERSNGDYYSVHGTNAEYVAHTVYKTSTVIKYLGGSVSTGLASCTMSRTVAENFMRDALLKHQLRLEIMEPLDTKQGSWKVARTASPGNLQEVDELLFANSDMVTVPLVMAVTFTQSVDQMHVGVAFADPAQRTFGVCEFIDNDVFSNLEALVIQLGVRECLVKQEPANKQLQQKTLTDMLDRCGVVATECARSLFSADVEQDLGRLAKTTVPVLSLPELDLKAAMASLSAIIQYLNLLADESNFGAFALSTHSLSQFMKLDASAVQALNLLPSLHDGASKTMSLLGLLNHCKTSQGKRLLAQWLKQPLLNVDDIEERLTLVEFFFNDTESRDIIRTAHLRSMPDFKRLSNRFQRGFATLQDTVRVYQVIIALPALCDALAACTDSQALINKHYLQELLKITEDLGEFRSLVETTVDLSMADSHEFMLRADFDDGLQETMAKMDAEMRNITAEHERACEDLDLESKRLKLEKHSTFGHCLRVSRTDGARLRGKNTRYFELSTLKTGVFFTTPALRESSRSYRTLSDSYTREQSSLVKEVIKVAASYSPVLERLNTVVAHLDVILSFAEASAMAPVPYTRPVLTSGDVHLVAARHPCLEVQEGVNFIANDVEMARDGSNFVIITGPNMGGKSTYIRQIGVIALMAQVGCFVPCDSAQLPIFDCILARVGAGDAQLKGVSTFMAEMLETASILKTATDKSLVIIDELGRGTSTYDGFGLAWAISEHIVKEIKCKCLFATHFHELTELESIYPSVDNRHVMARITSTGTAATGQRDLTLLYKIGSGVCDQSFGIHVAELANFPESIVRLAKRKVEELEDFGSAKPQETKMDVDNAEFSKEIMANGSRLIERFLSEFTNTPELAEMDAGRVSKRVKELKDKYESDIASNAWVQHVIATL
ncbi:MSH2 protein [Coemansia sp. RSA 353]|nr:MSH2 protein [Coemansia sp. RSA 788]KAJ2168720.1 MSH2 protein [Coemansia sp. RSA 562]KAJ2176438.1 MSH2 protein [Coemansia sp. RSA 560]KAJ2191170.1 MSH2 protein [Coemansia sp. RSA 532]KAJ2200149.1 MSH2 protein [Coemansia sp. RSA 530]KAJ2201794.1 MSH2 protein [Coemansia sp. RSA 522]KAJ2208947.1 MSH2 protein [Coemansia sp. RSA 521]KAJ2231382.1 MSH2 protein [Coemansia sp. RSA 518]KAJ2284000.1 MSH2 protein [Coemansia sp. RSA 370]KAJ2292428.1 MSH2 protein [Coemansia sp. RSA 355]KAJ2301368.1 